MVTISVKLDEDLVERIDAMARAMSAAAHGADVNRSNAMRVILEAGLEAMVKKTKPKK